MKSMKNNKKRLHSEREEVKELKRTIASMTPQLMAARGTPHQMMKLAEVLQARAHNSIDIGYIKTLLFPELYNADVPQPLSTQSYCRFTDRKEITIRSRKAGMLIWYPRTNVGPQLFIRYGAIDSPQTFSLATYTSDADNTLLTAWRPAAFQDYTPYFNMTTLVAASISFQYIGQQQNEQGYVTGSQVYGVSPSNLTTDDIDNGQFRSSGVRPGDGMRLSYVPRDMADFQYYTCSRATTGGAVRAHNGGQRPDQETINIAQPTKGQVWLPQVSDANRPWNDAGLSNIQYQVDADTICIYWKGLFDSGDADAPEDIKIDLCRKFNGMPLAKQRDILDLTKPRKLFDPKKTIEVVQELQSAIPQLLGHSLKQMDRVSDQIQEFLPNVGHLYNEGMLREGTSLEGFAGQLQMLAGTEGPSTGFPGRVYDV